MPYTNKVITLLGQSNAVGRVDNSLLPSEYSGWQHSVKIYDDNATNRYSSLNVGLNNNQFDDPTTDYGIEPFFSNFFSSRRDIYLMKCTKGATYLANNGGTNTWANGVSGGMFSTFKNTVKVRSETFMSGRGKLYSYPVVIWIQGEADSLNQTYANAYESNLNQFITDVNTELGANPTWLIVQLSANTTDPNLVYKNTIRTAQANVVAADTAKRKLITTDDLTFQGDGVHINAAGMKVLGDRIVAQCKTLIPS